MADGTTEVEVPLRFVNGTGWPARFGGSLTRPTLHYTRRACLLRQRRFECRDELVPQVDLRAYRATAVLDWVRLRFCTFKPHQAVHVRKVANTALKTHRQRAKAFVTGPDEATGYTGQEFLLTLQDPTPKALALVLSTLRDWFRGREEVQPVFYIDAVEVSVDFYVRNSASLGAYKADLMRWQMVELLRRHLRVLPDYAEQFQCWPRAVFRRRGNLRKQTQFVVAKKPDRWLSRIEDPIRAVGLTREEALLFHRTAHKPAPIDGTYYVGPEKGPVQVKIMDKVTDERDNTAGTFRELLPKDRRARIEVTVFSNHSKLGQGIDLERFGRVDDLYEFEFQTIRPKVFEFFIPTVRPEGVEPDLGLSRHLQEVEAFQRGGVYSLDRLHRAEQQLLQARRDHKLISKKPALLGQHGYLRSYLELNHMTDRALRKLTRDWGEEASFWEERDMGLYAS